MSHSQSRRLAKQHQRKTHSDSSSTSPSALHHENQSSRTSTTTFSSSFSSSSSSTKSCFSFNSKPKPKSPSHRQSLSDPNFSFPIPSLFTGLRHWIGKSKCGFMPFMANSEDVSVHVPSPVRGNKLSGKQKREELEREVSKLEKMLNHEEKVHKVLDTINSGQDSSSLQIPNFLPPETKELLVQLATVEGEIARLENQISKLQSNLHQEKELTKKVKSKMQSKLLQVNFPEIL